MPIRRRRRRDGEVARHRSADGPVRREGDLESPSHYGDVWDGRGADQRHHDTLRLRLHQRPGEFGDKRVERRRWAKPARSGGAAVRERPDPGGLAGKGRPRHRRGKHTWGTDAARGHRAALPAPRLTARLGRYPDRPLLRRPPPIPTSIGTVDPAAQRGYLMGRRQLVQGRATTPARQGAPAVEAIHNGHHA